MAQPKIFALTEDEAVQQIVETVQQAEKGAAPFALVLGSGFSHGLVPTARDIVEKSLPLWKTSLTSNDTFDQLLNQSASQHGSVARTFWDGFITRNAKRDLNLRLDPATGLPSDYSAAYRAAFDPAYTGAAGEPAQARRFQRTLMRLEQPRLNAAHFLLASLLGVQPGQSRKNDLFKARAAFSRLILTTNFDPFLQIALQAVNRLYFMSDTPELGVGDEILDDQIDTIHLVYLHGSIHRRSQAATDADIQALKEKNARTLAPVLKRHGVIVLGYSGWDDAIVEALAACDRFDHRLYWCGRESDPLTPGAFGPRVADILRKPTANYVQIGSAGHFTAQLCNQLVQGLPRLLDNPIGQLREMLQTIDLTEFESITARPPVSSGGLQPQPAADALIAAQKAAIERLVKAEQAFVAPQHSAQGPEATSPESPSQGFVAGASESASRAGHLLSSARAASALGNYAESIRLFTQALDLDSLNVSERAGALLERGLALSFSGELTAGQADWSSLIEIPNAPVEQVAQALNNRGVTWGQRGDTDQALTDYTRVIEQLPGAPVEHVATALYNRGVRWSQRGDTEKALADYTRVIEQLPGAPVEQVARALYNRGIRWGQRGDTDKAVADYTRLIEHLPGAPVEQVAQALNNRGGTWVHRGDTDRALTDFTRLIEHLPGAPVEQVASALYNRGVTWGQRGDTDKALSDYTRLIERLPGAPVEQVAQAVYNRGVAWAQKGDPDKALADYKRVIEQLPGAPVEQVAKALNNRGVTWVQWGDTYQALTDFTRVVEQLPGAPAEQVAKALNNRGIVWGQQGDTEKALADYTRLIEQLPGAPVEQAAQALNNRGVTCIQRGDTDQALADFTRVVEQLLGAPVEQVARALYNRGLTWGQRGDTEKALADFTRVIEQLPGAPVEQVAQALYNRGLAWSQRGDTDQALADFTRVIEQLPGAPVEQVAKALANRGWLHYQRNAFDAFLSDTKSALSWDPAVDFAAFNLGLALLACGRDTDAVVAYERAANQFPEAVDSLGLKDLAEAENAWLTEDRARPIVSLLKARRLQDVQGDQKRAAGTTVQ